MAKKQNDRVIANPMYDVVFKHLMMASKDIASYFVGTILGVELFDIDFSPQEYPYTKQIQREGSPKPTDLLRFRTYLGEQYKQQDKIVIKGDHIEKAMPIVIIYMLGFVFPEISAIAVKVNRTYIDIIKGGEVKHKCPFIESLTHDAFFIQIPRINKDTYLDWKNCSDLLKMLSLFEQDYFVDETFIKKYPYPITDKKIKKMVKTLEYIAVDPKMRRAMEEERWAELDEILWKQALAAKDNTIAQQAREIAELRRNLGLN
jgi:hypothetical protein